MNTKFGAATSPCRSSWQPCPSCRSRSLRESRSRTIFSSSLYELLGISSTASIAEIRTAYRRLAARYHPDQNSSLLAHEKFQAINLAAEVLTNDQLRRDYDSRGASALPGSKYQFLLDFMKQVRTQGSWSVLGERGADMSTVLGLDFQEAVTGAAAAVTLDVLGPCVECKGSGLESCGTAAGCQVCKGSGEIVVRRWDPDATTTSSSSSSSNGAAPLLVVPCSCPACRGSGKCDQQECQRCRGEGRIPVRRKVRFSVPGGVVDGQVLRVKGQGHSGRYGGAPGDLLVKLQVYDLADVTRQGDDLHSMLDLCLYEALLGGRVPVKTVRGLRNILVPAGTQHGQLLCVKNAGVPRPGPSGVEYGHHYFEVSVKVPSAAAASQDELQVLQQLSTAIQQQEGRVHHGPVRDRQQQHSKQQQGLPFAQLPQEGTQPPISNSGASQQVDHQRGSLHHPAGHRQQKQQQQDMGTLPAAPKHGLEPP